MHIPTDRRNACLSSERLTDYTLGEETNLGVAYTMLLLLLLLMMMGEARIS
jgi:hypothetical protein